MAQNKQVRFGPVALTTTLTTNILNPGTTTGGTGMPATSGNLYFIIKHLVIANTTSGALTASLWLGSTGTNSQGAALKFQATTIPANSYIESYDVLTLDVADFLVGGGSSATALTLFAEGEVGIR